VADYRRFRCGAHRDEVQEYFSRMTRISVPNSAGRRRKGGVGRWLLLLVLLLIGGSALWAWASLSWAYADGERAGVLQKFVRRGWLCKTQEGEIALYYGGGQYLGPNSSQQLWDFSVRDPAVAEQLGKAVGRRVQLHYTEHPGLPTSCFAETRYFVDRVTITDSETGAPIAPGSGAPGSGAPVTTPPVTPAPGSAAPGGVQPSPSVQPAPGAQPSTAAN
jgi:hypothetical protein